MVDTLGLPLGVMVTAADTGDRAATQVLLRQVADAHHQPALVRADGGYTGSLVEYCLTALVLVHQRQGHGLVEDPAHDPPPGPATPAASMNRPGCSASQPRATRRFAFDRSASIRAGTTSMPNTAAISWQVSSR
ncbi:transposase [Streptomyces sp. SA15]|uniref:transposase n=1 Tax=Streptomyces sp. SA15 TaxID=934019 RepID=UPI0015C92C56